MSYKITDPGSVKSHITIPWGINACEDQIWRHCGDPPFNFVGTLWKFSCAFKKVVSTQQKPESPYRQVWAFLELEDVDSVASQARGFLCTCHAFPLWSPVPVYTLNFITNCIILITAAAATEMGYICCCWVWSCAGLWSLEQRQHHPLSHTSHGALRTSAFCTASSPLSEAA